MKESIWQINDKNGNKLGILKVPDFLDILDVTFRAQQKFGYNSDWSSPIFIGDI